MKSTLKEELSNLLSTRGSRLSDYEIYKICTLGVIVIYILAIVFMDS